MSLAVFFLLLGVLSSEAAAAGVDWAALAGAVMLLLSAATLRELRR